MTQPLQTILGVLARRADAQVLEKLKHEPARKLVMQQDSDGRVRPRHVGGNLEDAKMLFRRKFTPRSENECWEWAAATEKPPHPPYGIFHVCQRAIRAHRFAFYVHHGHLPKALICHTCDNPKCVNPHHLFAGTFTDNNRDRAQKRRSSRASRHLSFVQAGAIRSSNLSQRDAAKHYGVSRRVIRAIRNGDTYRFP